MSNEEQATADSGGQRYFPAPNEAQLTPRAVVIGCLVGSIIACTNITIGLKIGWTFGASIVSAVLGFAFFSAIGKKFSVLETNIAQTAGSAAGSMASAAGLVAAIPAMELLGYNIGYVELGIWAVAVAFLGVFFAVPLRRQVVEIDKLRFPTGTATAETILAMFSDAGDALAKAKVLIQAALIAGLFAFVAYFIPQIEMPPPSALMVYIGVACLAGSMYFALKERMLPAILLGVWAGCFFLLDQVVPATALAAAAGWGFKMYLGPSLFGAGFLIGPRVSFSLLLGAIVAWAILGPIAQSAGWAPGNVMSYKDGARGWLLWPGVALMVSEALTSLALSWKTFVRALKMPKKLEGADPKKGNQHIPNTWWIGGLAIGTTLTAVLTYVVFDIPIWMSIVAVALSFILAIVAVRSVGETDINPLGGMGKVTQLVYGGVAPGQMDTSLMAAAITSGGASQAGDMMQDLKTGHLLGAAPRKQLKAQLWGLVAGIFFVIPVYAVVTSAWELGSDKLPAPAAFAWKSMAEVLAKGFDALPPMAIEAVIFASIIGCAIPIIRKFKPSWNWMPSGIAVGIAFIVPAYYSLVMFYGTVAWLIWKKKNPSAVEKFNFALASGLVAGEGLMQIINAVMALLKVPSLTG